MREVEAALAEAVQHVLADPYWVYDGKATAATLSLDSLDKLELAFALKPHFPQDCHDVIEVVLHERIQADTPLADVAALLEEVLADVPFHVSSRPAVP